MRKKPNPVHTAHILHHTYYHQGFCKREENVDVEIGDSRAREVERMANLRSNAGSAIY